MNQVLVLKDTIDDHSEYYPYYQPELQLEPNMRYNIVVSGFDEIEIITHPKFPYCLLSCDSSYLKVYYLSKFTWY